MNTQDDFDILKEWKEKRNNNSFSAIEKKYQMLIKKTAHKYKTFGVDMKDLYQQGRIGLMTAMDKFDESKYNNNFCGYAKHYVRAYINRYVMFNSDEVKFFRTEQQKKFFCKYSEWSKILSAPDNEKEELKYKFLINNKIDINRFEKNYGFYRPIRVSLTEVIKKGDQKESPVTLKADDKYNPETLISFKDEVQQARSFVDTYFQKSNEQNPERSKEIFLRISQGETLQSVGNDFNLSRERVRQIYAKHYKQIKELIKS